MPQEFHVVRCFKCEAFQVHIVKKVPKWECKICGEKQSVRQVYGKGTGKDCRLHVQKLNALRADEIPDNIDEIIVTDEEFDGSSSITEVNDTILPSSDEPKQSKWAEFLDEETETNDDNNIDENIYSSSKRLKLSDTNDCNETCSEFRNRTHEETDHRIRNQRTISSYFNSDKTRNRKAYKTDMVPIQSKHSIKNFKPSTTKITSYNKQITSLHNPIDQSYRKTIFESFKKTDSTLTQNIVTENKPGIESADSLQYLKPSNSSRTSYYEQIKSDHKTTDVLVRKTVFESFQDNDSLDSILDTDF
ncbi:MRN complex-interacting protein [Chrysoperla carnea]|uniref:MRN complex-interacting protein n=1 Tax=Chrysoperla carnea TaxID=189513 RepID=UPI001D05C85D|nr:MRN complex-interacting protein [Chrysoperla carnea]